MIVVTGMFYVVHTFIHFYVFIADSMDIFDISGVSSYYAAAVHDFQDRRS